MAAPLISQKVVPTGFKLQDGYRTMIVFALMPEAAFWEKTTTPPGMDAGDAVDTTTMHNERFRTKAPRCLIDMTDAETTVAYDPRLYSDIITELLGKPGAITVHFPDKASLTFWGFLRTFEPDALTEGEQPEATITVTPTNYDPYNCVEAAPVLVEAGTCTYPCDTVEVGIET